jgi:hypothetical protein
MTEWIYLHHTLPDTEKDIIGCDWYTEHKNEDFRIHVCEPTPQQKFGCGEFLKEKVLLKIIPQHSKVIMK